MHKMRNYCRIFFNSGGNTPGSQCYSVEYLVLVLNHVFVCIFVMFFLDVRLLVTVFLLLCVRLSLPVQSIACKDVFRVTCSLLSVEWDVKLQSLSQSFTLRVFRSPYIVDRDAICYTTAKHDSSPQSFSFSTCIIKRAIWHFARRLCFHSTRWTKK